MTSGVKFSTNGSRITPERAQTLAANDYLDVQVSLDGASARGQRRGPRHGLLRHRPAGDGAPRHAGMENFKLSVVVTRHNVAQLDALRRSPSATARSCG